jgi:hypothetical protein
VKLIVQLRKNAYAFELAVARVSLRDGREDEDDTEEAELDGLDEAQMRVDPAGSVYCQAERAEKSIDYANRHHCDEVRGFGFGR